MNIRPAFINLSRALGGGSGGGGRWAKMPFSTAAATEGASLTKEEKEKLRQILPQLRTDTATATATTTTRGKKKPAAVMSLEMDRQTEMDSIRARGILRYRYNYDPPEDLLDTLKSVATSNGLQLREDNWQDTPFESRTQKAKILGDLGTVLYHFVPNSLLHKMVTLSDVGSFYSEPVCNTTTFTEMARSENLPKNIAIREHPVRFHPNDKSATHGGETAFPGEGGAVLGIRTKRIYRQFRPKSEWYHYDDQTFDFEPVDKGMPWDPEVAKKMDAYAHKKFFVRSVKGV